jgi:sorbitol-6-phosphate 2-dehydrogenase
MNGPATTAGTTMVAPLLRGALAGPQGMPVVAIDASGGDPAPGPEILEFETRDGETPTQCAARLREAVAGFKAKTGAAPRLARVAGMGLLAAGATRACAEATLRAALAGEELPAPAAWTTGRLGGKVAVVTGAAQGFGLEIAQGMASAGAHVALADINVDGARAAAEELCGIHGAGRAFAVGMNVARPESIVGAVGAIVEQYGGFDVFVANAGVLRAGSVKDLSEKDFDFVTGVNYKGYFFCVQAAAPVMALQHAAHAGAWGDIIQINSKSGLEGSSRNGAYAGGKFGGIGLTQSFALELIADGIKVNSVCPGNFFDGPLWSDPETGLFVQYLRTGKVPGAKTVEDVKHFYEAKVPMGRGCRTSDVLKAIFYIIEQEYETGQAVPVTGGQVMLS